LNQKLTSETSIHSHWKFLRSLILILEGVVLKSTHSRYIQQQR